MQHQSDGTELDIADVGLVLLGVNSDSDVSGGLVPVIPTLDLFT